MSIAGDAGHRSFQKASILPTSPGALLKPKLYNVLTAESPNPRAGFRVGEWLVQPSLGRISRGEKVERLRPQLMNLLVFLARNAGRAVTRDEIIEHVWERRFIAESVLSRCVAELRQTLKDDSEKPCFIETIPKRGYRLIAPVLDEGPAADGAAPQPSIAVLPFTDMAREKDQEYFCDGLAEELTNALTRLRGLRVIARTSAFAFKGKAADVREIGRQLNASAILEGGVQRSGDRLRITVQLINAADGCHLWSERFDRAAGDVFAIQDEIAQAVAGELRVKLMGDDEARLLKRHTRDTDAHDLYLKGRYLSSRRTPDAYAKAVSQFQRALEKDPGFAPAYAALGECYAMMSFLGWMAPHSGFPDAQAAARKALDLDPALAEAHTVLGFAHTHYDWDWRGAESCFLRATGLSPSYAPARCWYSLLLSILGRFDEAVQEVERALDLDPLSLAVLTTAGVVLWEARRYDQALKRLVDTVEMDPGFALAQYHLGRVLAGLGEFERAIAPLEAAAPAFDGALGVLGAAYARTGRHDKAAAVRRELERLSGERYVGQLALFALHNGTQEIDAALEWLARSMDARDGMVPFIGVDTALDGLRSDPRFGAMLKRLGLPS